MTRDELIRRIESFAAATDVAPSTVTSRAVGNSRLYFRMKEGGSCTLEVSARLVAFMDGHSQSPTPTREDDAA